jgi:hypothetical protein
LSRIRVAQIHLAQTALDEAAENRMNAVAFGNRGFFRIDHRSPAGYRRAARAGV